jgi:enoyl-CoA hydratase/carnithine racemase
MQFEEIFFEKMGKIARVTLNRPDIRNALTGERMLREFEDAVSSVQEDEEVCVLVLTGAGSAFSAGGNVKDMQARTGMFAGGPEQVRENYRNGIQRIPLALHRLDVPTIAAVNGPAIGAGCDLACMCDIRIAGEQARFGETFVSVGLIPGDGGAYFLPRVLGFSKACELAFTCRVLDASEALGIGLVSEVVPDEKLMDRSMQLAREIARQPPKTLRMAKRLFYVSQGKSLEEVLELSAAYQAICHHSPEHAQVLEAMAARKKG